MKEKIDKTKNIKPVNLTSELRVYKVSVGTNTGTGKIKYNQSGIIKFNKVTGKWE